LRKQTDLKANCRKKKDEYVIGRLGVRPLVGVTFGSKLLPSACSLGQHLQSSGHSFAMSGP